MSRNGKKKKGRVLRWILLVLIVLAVIFFAYFAVHYSAGEKASEEMLGSETVAVSEIDDGWFFDGPGTGSAVIFYPGAKVESEAYAPLMEELAENGVDCFLMDMPLHFAAFGIQRAQDVLERYSYEHWYLAGHSVGGAMAAQDLSDHPEDYDGIILLAAYSKADISEIGVRVLSLYGTRDGVLNMEHKAAYRENLPAEIEEYVIVGGNHGSFGDYGEQKGDGQATIPEETQQEITAERILDFVA